MDAMALSHRERRHGSRKGVTFGAECIVGDQVYPCVVNNISVGGAEIRAPEMAGIDGALVLHLGNLGDIGAEVSWHYGPLIGLRFQGDARVISDLVVAVAMYGT